MPKPKATYKWSYVYGMLGSEGNKHPVLDKTVWCNSPDDFPNDDQRYIVATPFTTPDWFDLFMSGRISGLVTKIGGYLSHAAITARELKIPCILNTRVTANKIQNSHFGILVVSLAGPSMLILAKSKTTKEDAAVAFCVKNATLSSDE